MSKRKKIIKSSIATLLSVLFSLASQPAIAGSGSDGVFEVSWKDWKKSKAKNCARQKITVTLIENVDWAVPYRSAVADVRLFNNDDEEIANTFVIWDHSAKSSGAFQYCKKPGPGPYYVNVKWQITPLSQLRKGEFEIPFKFKK
jgi:hypothetical protein